MKTFKILIFLNSDKHLQKKPILECGVEDHSLLWSAEFVCFNWSQKTLTTVEPYEKMQSLAALDVRAFLFVINVRLRIDLVHRASISNHLQNLAGYWKVSVQQRHIAAKIGWAQYGMSDINYARSYLRKGAKNAQNVREVANISPVWYFNQTSNS